MGDLYPLTSAQERLWFMHRLSNTVQTVPWAVRLRGALHRVALEEAVRGLAARHVVLRSAIVAPDETPVHVVCDAPAAPLVFDEAPHEEAARERVRARMREPIDLESGAPWRAGLVRIDDDDHFFYVQLHHVVSDQWSLEVLRRELATSYEVLAEGGRPRHDVPPSDYCDYTRAQAARGGGEDELAWWNDRLAGCPPLRLLPDHARGTAPIHPRGTVRRELDLEGWDAVQGTARSLSVTPFSFVLAAWFAVLGRAAGQHDFAVGIPVFGRDDPWHADTVGLFVNTVAVRVRQRPDGTFAELVSEVHAAATEAYARQHVPFERVVERVNPPREPGRMPLFQTMVNLHARGSGEFRLNGLEIELVDARDETTAMDLGLLIRPGLEGLALRLDYSSTLFDPPTVDWLGDALAETLRAAAVDPRALLGRLPLADPAARPAAAGLPAEERARVEAFGRGALLSDAPHVLSVLGAADGAATAVIEPERSWTMGDLRAAASALAERLPAGAAVGVCLPPGAARVAAMLAAWLRGSTFVPLDPDHPAARIGFLVRDAGLACVVADGETAALLPEEVAVLLLPCVHGDGSRAWPEDPGTDGGPPAALIYTSGSTGTPKGVRISHANLAHTLAAARAAFAPRAGDVMPLLASCAFDISLLEILLPLSGGGAAVVVPTALRDDPDRLLEVVDGCTLLHAVPSLMATLLRHRAEVGSRAGAGLRHVFTGGDAVPPVLLHDLRRAFPGAALEVLYGPTEATIICAAHPIGGDGPPETRTLGRPLPGAVLRVVDEGGAPRPVGVPGELWVGGGGVAAYHARPELEAERFAPYDGHRFYRTGDRAAWREDGTLEFHGRVDDQVKVRGFRIEPGEVEAALLAVPGVARAAVVTRPGPDGEPSLAAHLEAVPAEAAEWWPSLGEYPVYDEMIYAGLTGDSLRNERYRAALEAAAPGRVVVDIGTGRDAVLARLAAEAGARRVYALEVDPVAAAAAREAVARAGLADRITVVEGDASAATLPEPADLLLGEVFESFAGAEGAVRLYNGVRRHLRSGGGAVPSAAETRVAAVSLPDALRAAPGFRPAAAQYVERIFAAMGGPFDLRLTIKDLPAAALLSGHGCAERLELDAELPAHQCRAVSLTVTAPGHCHGLLFWLRLELAPGITLDTFREKTAWFPAFVPLSDDGIPVSPGDRIEVVVETSPSADGVHPDYRIHGHVAGTAFHATSPYRAESCGTTPPYDRLVVDGRPAGRAPAARALAERAAAWLNERLPAYMVPPSIVVHDALPLNANGKVDRGALRELGTAGTGATAPRGATEAALLAIWHELLGRDDVGVHDDFFQVGGHSLLAMRVVARVRRRFNAELPLRLLFSLRTVAALAGRVDAERAAGAPADLPQVDRDGPLPLSFAQRRLWVVDQLREGGGGYTMATAVRLRGPLDVDALARTLAAIVDRHEPLRMAFSDGEGAPVARILRCVDLDLTPRPAADRAEAEAQALELGRQPFDLRAGPLVRTRLLRVSGEEHVLAIAIHHVVSDGWSVGVLNRELAALYEAFSGGRPSPLPPLRRGYVDLAAAQLREAERPEARAAVDAWARRLADLPPLALPVDRPRPAVSPARGARHAHPLDEAFTGAARRCADAHGCTLFMVLFGAFAALMHRWCGQDDFAVGVPVANRTRVEADDLIGLFVNMLVLRVGVDREMTFEALLRQVRAAALDAFAQQDTPFERVVEAVRPERASDRYPLIQVTFALQNVPRTRLALRGLEIAALPLEWGSTRFDLELHVFEEGSALRCLWIYSTTLFDAATVQGLSRAWTALAAAAFERPALRLDALPLGGSLACAVPTDDGPEMAEERVDDLFAAAAAAHPDRIALTDGDTGLTFSEAERRSAALAAALRARGVGPGSFVGLTLPRGVDALLAVLATWRAGAAYVPLDPAYPAERNAAIAASLRLAAVVGPPVPGSGAPSLLPSDASPEADAPAGAGTPADLAYVIHTSGTTGIPRGVMVEHRSVVHLIRALEAAVYDRLPRGPLRVAVNGSLAFDTSVKQLVQVARGHTLVAVPDEVRADPAALVAFLERCGVQVLDATPSQLRPLLDAGLADVPSLAAVLVGGEAIDPALWTRLAAVRRPVFFNLYGPTECTVDVTAARIADAGPLPTLGTPLPGFRLEVVDPAGNPVPCGFAGELVVHGPQVARGYFGEPGGPPFGGEWPARRYATGDRVRRRPDGSLVFMERMDRQVKVRGHRVELVEVEARLLEQPGVAAAAAEVDEMHGLVAWVETRPEFWAPDAPPVREWHQAALSRWREVHEHVYAEAAEPADPALDLAGWTSSFTGEPIPHGEMREWLDRTLARLRALRPRRILEVGCGSGMLLFGLAPEAEAYHGVDFSGEAVRRLRARLGALGVTVRLDEREAAAIGDLPARAYDTVILNSVVQYFPSLEYLSDVLDRAVERTADGGTVFVGDVRHHALLDAFHAELALSRAGPATPLRAVWNEVERAKLLEKELAPGDEAFLALARRNPRVAGIAIDLREGVAENELTRYRCDVRIAVGPRTGRRQADLATAAWEGMEALERRLCGGAGAFVVRGIPNRRVAREVEAWRLLATLPPSYTAAELGARLERAEDAVDPDVLREAAARAGFGVRVSVGERDPATVDAVFARGEPPLRGGDDAPPGPAANLPLRGQFAGAYAEMVERGVREVLPAVMVPSAITLIDALPLTAGKKLDRARLPRPERLHAGGFVAPRGETEAAVAGIWSLALRLDRVGAEDDFFALGGHSLLAIQVTRALRERFVIDLPLRVIFERRTVAAMAEAIETREEVWL